MVLYYVLHYYPVQGYVASRQQSLVQQLLPHEVHKHVVTLWLQLREYAVVCGLPDSRDLLDVLLQGLQIIVQPVLVFPRTLLRLHSSLFLLGRTQGLQDGTAADIFLFL